VYHDVVDGYYYVSIPPYYQRSLGAFKPNNSNDKERIPSCVNDFGLRKEAMTDCGIAIDFGYGSSPSRRCLINEISSELSSDGIFEDASTELLGRLKTQESKHYRPLINYLSVSNHGLHHEETDRVSEIWRQKVCEWSYQVIDHYNFNREVVFIALNYLDRMVAQLAAKDSIRKTEFRLVAVTSLYMAVKLHGIHASNDGIRRKLRISSFHELSERCFTIEQIEDMEVKMLSTFDWYVNPPTPLTYIDSLLSLCPEWVVPLNQMSCDTIITSIKDLALYLTELAVAESRFTFLSNTCVVSFSSILLAMRSMKASARIPTPIYNEFVNRVAEAITLFPGDADVIHTMNMLREMCPDILMAEDDHLREELNSSVNECKCSPGKASPVCVVDIFGHDDSPGQRKRGRGENR
jgi:Cyclin, N-terminal domain